MPIALMMFLSLSPVLLWLFSIRPYCVRNGKGYTTGSSAGITIWVDWQEAKELAKEKGDKGMQWVCTVFLILNLVIMGGMALTFLAAVWSE